MTSPGEQEAEISKLISECDAKIGNLEILVDSNDVLLTRLETRLKDIQAAHDSSVAKLKFMKNTADIVDMEEFKAVKDFTQHTSDLLTNTKNDIAVKRSTVDANSCELKKLKEFREQLDKRLLEVGCVVIPFEGRANDEQQHKDPT